jgi:hypothetical protein
MSSNPPTVAPRNDSTNDSTTLNRTTNIVSPTPLTQQDEPSLDSPIIEGSKYTHRDALNQQLDDTAVCPILMEYPPDPVFFNDQIYSFIQFEQNKEYQTRNEFFPNPRTRERFAHEDVRSVPSLSLAEAITMVRNRGGSRIRRMHPLEISSFLPTPVDGRIPATDLVRTARRRSDSRKSRQAS